MPTDLTRYPHPYVAADIAIFCFTSDAPTRILLVKRKNDPFRGKWVLPGGFCEPKDATIAQTAARELREETGLKDCPEPTQVHTYTANGRDPRGWIFSILHTAVISPRKGTKLYKRVMGVKGLDDAAEAKWWTIQLNPECKTWNLDGKLALGKQTVRIKDLAFDHGDMLQRAIRHQIDMGYPF
jgi:8-oxo-dGTP diphosphatase